MIDYLLIGGKTVLFYFILIVVMRLMGKREVGELSIFDVVVYFVITELLSISISEPEEDPMQTIIAIVVIVILQLITAFVALRVESIRRLIEGTPLLLIKEGVIDQTAMRKQKYTVDDLMSQLREKNIQSPSEIAFAILENSGTLTIVEMTKRSIDWPFPFVKDGIIDKEALIPSGYDKKWLLQELMAMGYPDVGEIFIALKLLDGWLIIPKQDGKNGKKVKTHNNDDR